MEISVSALLLFLHPAFPKLIVAPEKEAQLSAELLLKEGDLVKSFQQPGPCNEVQEEVTPPVLILKKTFTQNVDRYFYQRRQLSNSVSGASSTILPPIWPGEECDNCIEPKLLYPIQLPMEL